MYKCLDCEKQLSSQHKSKHPLRCKSCSKKGKLNPLYINGERTKERMCVKCGVRISSRSSSSPTKHCLECKAMPDNRGKNNPMYGKRGDLSPAFKHGNHKLTGTIRNLFESRQWRSDIFTRDNFTCQSCFNRGGKLNAHHIKPFSKIMEDNNINSVREAMDCEEMWNINNGITLCVDCHKKTDTYLKRTICQTIKSI